jgi:hypothetical protein
MAIAIDNFAWLIHSVPPRIKFDHVSDANMTRENGIDLKSSNLLYHPVTKIVNDVVSD